MLHNGSYRPHIRGQRSGSLVLALVFATSLFLLAVGATIARFAVDPGGHPVEFPPGDWSVAPPNWVD